MTQTHISTRYLFGKVGEKKTGRKLLRKNYGQVHCISSCSYRNVWHPAMQGSNLYGVAELFSFFKHRNQIWSQNSCDWRRLYGRSRNLRTHWSPTSNAGYRSVGQQCRHVVQPSGILVLCTRFGRFLQPAHALQRPLSHGHDTPLAAQNGRTAQRSHPQCFIRIGSSSIAASLHVLQHQGENSIFFWFIHHLDDWLC